VNVPPPPKNYVVYGSPRVRLNIGAPPSEDPAPTLPPERNLTEMLLFLFQARPLSLKAKIPMFPMSEPPLFNILLPCSN